MTILKIVAPALATPLLMTPPAQASTGSHSVHLYASHGVSISWGNTGNMNDLKIERVSHSDTRSTSAEDASIGQKILTAYLNLQKSVPNGHLYAGDHCTKSPDSYGKADFKPACDAHDRCYSPDSSTSRKTCDERLKSDLNKACNSSFSSWWEVPDRKACNGVAWTYYQFVRKFGGQYYHGHGSKD